MFAQTGNAAQVLPASEQEKRLHEGRQEAIIAGVEFFCGFQHSIKKPGINDRLSTKTCGQSVKGEFPEVPLITAA